MATLGLNIDHIATIRQARGGNEPDPVAAALLGELAGALGITAHLREDRRHMQDRDIRLLKQVVTTHLNLEMACTAEMVAIALEIVPGMVTLVPEKREERTTEGGLAVRERERELAPFIEKLRARTIPVSTFIAPAIEQVEASARVGATHVELHTGYYSNVETEEAMARELVTLREAARAAAKLGLRVNAGHGLNYRNAGQVARIENIEELNIGHSIIGRAALVGIDRAVRDMVALIACGE
jgi:pyridoxine 5-phosphate synthase